MLIRININSPTLRPVFATKYYVILYLYLPVLPIVKVLKKKSKFLNLLPTRSPFQNIKSITTVYQLGTYRNKYLGLKAMLNVRFIFCFIIR